MVYPTTQAAVNALVRGGFSIVPVKIDGSKAPALSEWKPYQIERPAVDQVRKWFGNGATRGIAAIQGKVSGNAETIDFDDVELFDPFCEELEKQAPGLLERLVWTRTPRPGYQITYRCRVIGRNRGLAFGERPARPDDPLTSVYENDQGEFVVRYATIETRGEGGYIIAVGSPARVHKNNKPYEFVNGDYEHVPEITPEERDVIFSICEGLSQLPIPAESESEDRARMRRERRPGELPAGDDYNERGDNKALIEKHGWTYKKDDRFGELWTRPGKDTGEGHSARLWPNRNLLIFTSNGGRFKQGRCYSPFAQFTELEHGGDFKAAAKALYKQGYGSRDEGKSGESSTDVKPEPAANPEPAAEEAEPVEKIETVFDDENLRGDHGNAARFLNAYRETTRYIYERKKFLCFDGRQWSEDQGVVEARANRIVQSLRFVEAKTLDEQGEWFKFYVKNQTPERRNAMLAVARPEIRIKADAFDADPESLNVANGTIHLPTGEKREHNPRDYCSKISKVQFDKDAECPLWREFLRGVFNDDQDLIAFIQRAVGYSLSGLTIEQVLFLLYGIGKNGKSTFVNVISRLMGEYAASTQMETFAARDRAGNGHNEDLANLCGARLVTAIESEESKRLSESLIKQVTGDDPITASRKHEHSITFPPLFKLWLAANHKPIIRGTDEGIWRRPLLIPFLERFEINPDKRKESEREADPRLKSKLFAEMPGILNWALEGFRFWNERGLRPPQSVLTATEKYREESDLLGAFIEECLEKRKPIGSEPIGENATQIFKAWSVWCDENGEYIGTQTWFGTRMKERGIEKGDDRKTNKKCYPDMFLKPGIKTSKKEKSGLFDQEDSG